MVVGQGKGRECALDRDIFLRSSAVDTTVLDISLQDLGLVGRFPLHASSAKVIYLTADRL